jgi:site-specific recombinase XerD
MSAKPQPLFDTYATFKAMTERSETSEETREREYIAERPAIVEYLESFSADTCAKSDFAHVKDFLKSYNGLETTFRGYRTQVERLMLWSWIKAGKSVLDLTRSDAEAFMEFVLAPDPEWIGGAVRHRFIKTGEIHEPNADWRPFTTQGSKQDRKLVAEGLKAEISTPTYMPAQGSVRQVFAICSSFYDYLGSNGVSELNPFRAIKQKSKFTKRNKKITEGRALTKLQWDFVVETAEQMAAADPERHERTLFILVTLFSMYLRVSDIVGNDRWTPTMGAFRKVGENWWMEVNGKGNKDADISVRPEYLTYLMRYRATRNLTPLPSRDDTAPLLTKLNGEPGLTDRHVRSILQQVFDEALRRMKEEGFGEEEIGELREASVHWLRHTSATFDAPFRDIKHLQADLRHENMSVTQDVYYNVDDKERARSIAGLKIK